MVWLEVASISSRKCAAPTKFFRDEVAQRPFSTRSNCTLLSGDVIFSKQRERRARQCKYPQTLQIPT